MKTALKTASVLAFERKLDPSDATFSSGNWQDVGSAKGWKPIAIREKSVRGTISNRLKTKDQDPAKLDREIQNPNLQTIDVATLASTDDTLRVDFTLRVLSGVGVPSACNDSDYQKKVVESVNKYLSTHGLSELSYRYAYNLANGRFLWRNRIGAENVIVEVSQLTGGSAVKSWRFEALKLSLRNFHADEQVKQSIDELSELIEAGLSGKTHVLLGISAYVRTGAGQEVFPSQELILDKGKSAKSRTLYDVQGVAGIHSQKLGNAIRSIDTWYPEAEEIGPIAVEPYGSVTSLGMAFRQPKAKADFYTLLDGWMIGGKELTTEEQHYVVAVLIRGGVFGETEKEK